MRIHNRLVLSGLTLLGLFFVSLSQTGCGEVSRESFTKPKPNYAVWDLEFTSAYNLAGKKYRIASISNLPSIDRSTLLIFNSEVIPSYTAFGYDGLPHEWPSQMKPGETRDFEIHAQEIYSLFHHEKIDARGVNTPKARGHATLIASCPVDVVFRDVKALQSKTSGMWTIPVIGVEKRAEISKPSCYQKTDRDFQQAVAPVQSEESQKEILRSQELSKKEDEKRDRAKKRTESARSFESQTLRAAREREKALTFKPDSSKTDFISQIRNGLCPRQAAIAEELGITKIKVARTEIARTQHAGYTSVRHEPSVTFIFKDGRESKFTHAVDQSRIVYAVTALTPDNEGCFQIEVIEHRQYEDYGLIEATTRTLRELLQRQIEDLGYERAYKEFPEEAETGSSPPPSP